MALTRSVTDYKDSVKAATTGSNITLSGGAPNTLDGITLAANDRVLVKDQTDASQNGIYRVTTLGTGSNGSWTRSSDFNDYRQISSGALTFVEQGAISGNIYYYVPGGEPNVQIGTTAVTFSNLYTLIVSTAPLQVVTNYGNVTTNPITAASFTTNSGGQHIGYHTGAIGANAANTGAFTTLTTSSTIVSQGTITGAGQVIGYHTGAIGANTPNTIVATSVTTSSGGQHIGYLTGAIGANTPNTIVATSVTTSSGGQISGYLTGAIGANTANTGNFSSITTTGSGGNITGTNTGYIISGYLVANNNTYANSYLWYNNNAPLATTITGTYSNSNVASYLPTYSGAITASTLVLSGTASSYGAGQGALQIAGGFYAAGDSYIAGNLVVANITSIGYNSLVANSALLYLEPSNIISYNYEIGFYSHKYDSIQGYNHTGIVRNHLDNSWYVFSNIRTEPTTVVDLSNAYIIYDTVKLGNAIVYGNIVGGYFTGAIGANGANTGAFTTVTATGNITSQSTILATAMNAGTIGNSGAIFQGISQSLTGQSYAAGYLAINGGQLTGYLTGAIGANTANTGAFTTITSTGTIVSQGTITGAGQVIGYFNGAVGANTANTGNFTTVVTTSNLYAGGNIIAASGTNSTSSTTGALVVTGGAGISGNIYLGSNVFAGTLTYSDVNIKYMGQLNINSYVQSILQNSNNGTTASADFIVNNDQSTASTYYGDFGINSSGFSGSGSLSAPNNVYLTSTSSDLVLGTTTSNAIRFVVNSGATDSLIIDTNGNVVVQDTTTSTSSTTGALVVQGGVGVIGNINVGSGGNIYIGSIPVGRHYGGNTAPASPNLGDTWYQGNTDVLFKYIQDAANNRIWLDLSSNPSSYGNLTVANTLTINGNLSASVTSMNITGGTSGYVLRTDGNGNLSWVAVSATAGGSNTMVQFSDAGSLGGATYVQYNKTSGNLVSNSTTTSTSTTTGAIVAPSLGVSGNVNANAYYSNYYLYSNGNPITTPAGGSNTMIQFNNSGTFTGATYLQYNLTSGNLVSNSTTQSTSTSTGALVLAGGLGVGGNIYAANILIGSTTTLTGVQNIGLIAGSSAYLTIMGARLGDTGSQVTGVGALEIQGSNGSGSGIQSKIDFVDKVPGGNNLVNSARISVTNSATATNVGQMVFSTYSGSSLVEAMRIYENGNIITPSTTTITHGTVSAVTVNAGTIGNSGAVLYGTLNSSSASQTNITSVGTLTGLTLSGAINGQTINGTSILGTTIGNTASAINGNLITASAVYAGTIGNTGATFTGAGATFTTLTSSTHTPSANLTYNLGSTSSSWQNLYVGSIISSNGGSSGTSAITITNYNTYGSTGYAGMFTLTNTYPSATTPNKYIRLNSSGGIEVVNNAYNAVIFTIADSGATTVAGALTPGSNNAVTLGSASAYWSTCYAVTFTGTSTTAKYADLAEMYHADDYYAPGTVMVFGGDLDVTIAKVSHDTRIAGVVSTNPAYLMNDNFEQDNWVPVALTGRVPCNVQGPVQKGDLLVSSDKPGIAIKLDKSKYEVGCIIGKSLDIINDTSVRKIEIAVGRY